MKKINLFELSAKIKLDSSDYERGIKQADEQGKGFSSRLKSGLQTAAKVGAAALAAAGTAIVAVTKQAVAAYADYEQLVGGVETLFKDSADIVMDYAANAYKTAGLSANQYMETVTSFSASLMQSLGGDSELAAEYSDRAVRDMADNANKMGTSMDSIMLTYQSLARGNFAMLDNLKLGYGGTKQELERLIADASKMTDVQKELGITVDESSMSFGNIINAISVVQKEIGITGTTAKEASETISGSTAAMKAAWQNLLVGMADDNADFGTLVNNLVDSAVTVGENIIPRVEQTIQGLGRFISGASDNIIPLVVDTIVDNLPMLISAGVDLVVALAGALVDAIPELLKATPQIVLAIANGLLSLGAKLYEAGANLMGKVKDAIKTAVDAAKQWGKDLIQNFIDGIKAKFQALKDGVKNVAQTVKDFLGFSEPEKGPLSNFHTYAPDMMALFAKGIKDNEHLITDQIGKSFNFGADIVGTVKGVGTTTSDGNFAAEMRGMRDDIRNMRVVLEDGTLVGKIAPKIDTALGQRAVYSGRYVLGGA